MFFRLRIKNKYFRELLKKYNPQKFKYTSSVINILLLIIVLLTTNIFFNKKTNPGTATMAEEKVERGVSGDFWADVVLGQPDFTEGIIKERVGFKVNNPGGVVIDRTSHPNRVFVSDNANSRILAYKSLGFCSNNEKKECTSNKDCIGIGGGFCKLTTNKKADRIIGQPNEFTAACNGDYSYVNYPYRAIPSAATLCGMPESQISPLEGGVFVNFDTDSEGNLYYPDWVNNRVLFYKNPLDSDGIADDLWGQDNFSGFDCNKGNKLPSAETICLGFNSSDNPAPVLGLDVDSKGNLWLADTLNNRILRYPTNVSDNFNTPSHAADLVLGQPDFNSNQEGNALNQLKHPGAVKVADNGDVFVADTFNDRVLKFPYPQTNGMSGVIWGSSIRYPASLEFDVTTNGIWVNDFMNRMIELWNREGTKVLKVLFKDIYSLAPRPNAICQSPIGICILDDCRGSIGITDNGDIFLSSSSSEQDVVRFPAPIPELISKKNRGILPSADFRLYYPPYGHNLLTGRSFTSPAGVTVANDQLIVSDAYRVLFWNKPSQVVNWKFADGVVGAADFNSENPENFGRVKADKAGHLYVIHKYNIEIYKLPLTTNAKPIKIITPKLMNLEGELVDLSANGDLVGGGIYPTKDGKFLWIAHNFSNRVVRIRSPLTNPVVDIILGQISALGVDCNMGGRVRDMSKTLCSPGAVVMDKYSNVFIADNSLEVAGNGRLLEYDAEHFPVNNSKTIYAVSADKIIRSGIHVFEQAFDSLNRMVIGYNSYNYSNPKHSLDYFNNILESATPSGSFNDYYVMPTSLAFDSQDNLYVLDHNRWRVNIYYNPFNNLPPSILPSIIPSATPSLGTPFSSLIPTSIPKLTPTLTPEPRSKPTPTPVPKSIHSS